MTNKREDEILDELLDDIDGIDDAEVEGYLADTQTGNQTNIMGDGAGDEGQGGNDEGEGDGGSGGQGKPQVEGIQYTEKGNTQFTAEQMKALSESATTQAYTDEQLAKIEEVRSKTEVVGYVYSEDETQAIEAVAGYKRDSKGDLILKSSYKSQFPDGNPSDKDLRAKGLKKSEVYERETTLVLKSKAPSGLLGMLLKAPTDALTNIVAGEFQAVNAGAPQSLYPLSKNAFTTILTDALNGEVTESAKIVDKYLPKRGQNPVIVNPDQEDARKLESVVKFIPYSAEELAKITDGTKGRESNRVRHKVRSGFAQPGNYIALKKPVIQEGLDGKLTPEQALDFNKKYLSKFLVERKGVVVANQLPAGTLTVEGPKIIDSVWFSANAAMRTATLSVEHWGALDASGKRRTDKIALPKMEERTTSTGKKQMRRVTKELVPAIPEGANAADFILFDADKSFDKVREAAGKDLLTFDVITDLIEQNQKEKQASNNARAGSKKELVGAEAHNVRKANNGQFKVEGRMTREEALKALAK